MVVAGRIATGNRMRVARLRPARMPVHARRRADGFNRRRRPHPLHDARVEQVVDADGGQRHTQHAAAYADVPVEHFTLMGADDADDCHSPALCFGQVVGRPDGDVEDDARLGHVEVADAGATAILRAVGFDGREPVEQAAGRPLGAVLVSPACRVGPQGFGKGPAFVRTKLKAVLSGKVVDKTFNAGTKVETANVDKRTMQYLYKDGSDFVFMDTDTYDQLHVAEDVVGTAAGYLLENQNAIVATHDGVPLYVELPASVVLEVSHTEPGLQGSGLGRRMVAEAERWAADSGCRVMDLSYVNLREELPAIYRKLGYCETGTAPFMDTWKLRMPAEFVTMSRELDLTPAAEARR